MSQILISSDSHVVEPHDLWANRLPAQFRSQMPRYAPHSRFQHHNGGQDPGKRALEMAEDGVSGEVLYASLALSHFGITDAEFQEACFRVYNDWLIEYCSRDPDRLFGLGLISCYRMDKAVEEVRRCKEAGMRGIMIWQVPTDDLPFTSRHYDPLWAICQDLQMPVNLHVLTGIPYGLHRELSKELGARLRLSVNRKLLYACDSLSDIFSSGALDRFPNLKIVLVESEVSWLPYALSQWDKYHSKGRRHPGELNLLPSEYFQRQVFATFFNDPPAGTLFTNWGIDKCMWSNDFPHSNSPWPNSRELIDKDLGHLPKASQDKLLWQNCAKLYNLPVLEPADKT